ncbi:MAG: HlyD family efflux transporter periplasmic adaptor subunit [candidate division Zixibacteria bacterium]|nr:HlyD family efflux transporter periplasmic adaptor subunit [candidate division Zixibacteria bacterium]
MPKFRSDLEISEQDSSGQVVFVIKDPISGKFYRLKEMEYFIAGLFNGENDINTIALKFEERFKAKIDPRQLEKFGNNLSNMGLLEKSGSAEEVEKAVVKKSLFSRILFIKIKAINPERFIERTYRLASPFYSKTAVRIYLLLAIWAVIITIANFDDMKFQLINFFIPEIIPLVWITIFFVTLLHEFSHTYSCRLHGGKVSDMGFLLLYVQPCFYSNVSDAYLFPDKRKRMAVTVAGIISQIVVWGLAVLIWRLTAMDNIINTIAFIIIALSFVGVTFNLNPLLKLDGYYFLVDYWEIPNLRQKAFRHLRQHIMGLAEDEEKLDASPREHRIFFWYGFASLIYSGLLITYIVYRGGKFLDSQFGGFGVAILGIIMLYFIFDAMKKGRIFQVAYNQRGAILRPGRLMITGAVIVIMALASIFIKAPLRITNDSRILPLERINLKMTSPGSAELIIERANEEKILKQYQLVGQEYSVLSILPALKVGDIVKSGNLIASIKSNVYETERLERYANLEQAQTQLDLLEKGAQPEEIEQTEDIIRQVRVRFQKAGQDLNRAESLFAMGGIAEKELEETRTNNQVLKSELDFYINQRTLLKRGARAEEIEIAQAQVNQLKAKLSHLESQLEQTIIVSPIDGIVTRVNKDNTVISIARTDTVKVKISVPEKEISAVALGNSIKMKVRSYPGLTYSGQVAKIDPLALSDEKDRPMFAVTAIVANPEGLLKSGMTGKVKINCGERPLYKLIFWRLIRYLRIEFWSWW